MRIYGSEPGKRSTETPGHRYAALIGGPLDGQRLDVTGWSVQQLLDGAALITELGAYGPGGRAHYGQHGDPGWLFWVGDSACRSVGGEGLAPQARLRAPRTPRAAVFSPGSAIEP